MNLMRSLKTNLLCTLLILLSPVLLFGQSEKGSIIGVITDPTGARVPGASVTVTNLGTKTAQTFTTNDEGFYEAPFLIPATYSVMVKHTGFKTSMVNEVTVNVGDRESVDVQLETGDIEATVVVAESSRPLLQTENANIGTVVTTKQLTELPSQERNIYSFLTLDSTVNNGPVGNAENFRVETGGSFSISGSRPSSVTFKIDGQANNDPTFGTPTITPSLESVKEFQLQNNAYSAEFEGITQVNVATKGGTDRLHGSVFDFVQNDLFQPRNPNAPRDASGKPGKNRLRFNQFGATFSGPLWLPRFGEGGPAFFNKDRTFFFFSYEGRRNDTINLATTARVLTAAERRGDFSALLGACVRSGTVDVPLLNPNGTPSGQCIRTGQIFDPTTTVANPLFNPTLGDSALNPQFIRRPFANNQIPQSRLDPTALALIAVQQPLPNFVSASDVNFLGSQGTAFQNNQYSIRLDHKFSDQDNIYGRLTVQNNRRINKMVLPFTGKNIDGNGKVFNSSWTHIFSPSIVNELRLGYVRGVYGDSITDEIDPLQFGVANTTLNTLPRIALTSGTPLNYGGFSASVLRTIQNTYQIADNLSFITGRHAIKFGGKVDHNRFQNGDLINTNGTANFNGLFSVGNSGIGGNANRNNSIADFLLGQVSSTSLNITNYANLRHTPWAAYVQDDWRVSPRVTVNLGLRYEFHQPFKEESLGGRTVDFENGGHVIVADPEVARLANSPLVVCCTGSRVVETDKNDFGPRIGVAIQPFKDSRTVIRAGYGLFYADTSQFFHWLYYVPLRGTATFNPVSANFQSPSAALNNLFPSNRFSPPSGSGLAINIPSGVNPAAVNNQPVVSIFAIGSYKTPQSQQWSVGVQREIWHDMVVDISYAGNVTKNLPVQWFFNQPTFSPVAVNLTSLDPRANPYLRRPFANFTIGSNIVANVLSSNYNAGTLKVDKRFSQGFSFTSTYTWSKSIDQGAEVFTTSSNHAFLPDNHNFDANRGVSVFDVPHRWVTNGIVELPFGQGKRFLNSGGWKDKLFGGFRLSGVFTLQSGLPFTPYSLNLRTNTGISIVERGDLVGEPYLSGDEWDAAVRAWETQGIPLAFVRKSAINTNYPAGTRGNLGRNVFRAPYGRSLNLSLAKITRLGEVTRLELRMDMFNVTREVLHATNRALSVRGPAALTSVDLGTIQGRNLFFVPHTIQLGAKLTF